MREWDPDHFTFPRQSGLRSYHFKKEPWIKLNWPTALILGISAALITSIVLAAKFTGL